MPLAAADERYTNNNDLVQERAEVKKAEKEGVLTQKVRRDGNGGADHMNALSDAIVPRMRKTLAVWMVSPEHNLPTLWRPIA